MFIGVQIIIPTMWNQPRYPLMDNLAEKKKCYKYAIEYCLAIKKEQNLAFAIKWMQL